MKRKVFSVIFLVIQYYTGWCTPAVIVNDLTHNIDVGKHLMILEDKNNRFTINEVIQSKDFSPTQSNVPHLRISPSWFWVKFEVTNRTDNQDFLFVLNQPLIDNGWWYVNKKNGHFEVLRFGNSIPFHKRKYNEPNHIFDIQIKKNTTQVFFFKIKCNKNIQLPAFIGTQKTVFAYLKNIDLLSGIYCGIMLAIIIFNSFLYFSVRDKSYLLYVVFVILILLTQTSLQGYPFQFLWPNTPWLEIHSLYLWPSLVGIAGLEFMKEFLKVKSTSRILYNLSFLFIIIYCISIVLGVFKYYLLSYIIMEINAVIVSLFMLYTPVTIFFKGYQPARFFIIAWFVFLIGVCIYVLKDFGILPYNNFTRYTMQVGSALETILISFALADKINILKREKAISQKKMVEILKENEKIITEQNILLELKVKERTIELEESNKHLKETQSQLVSAEKMASLGQLTAGIAHEINNPINFVVSNVKPLRRDIDDILQILIKYNEIKDENELRQNLAIIEHYKKTIDMDYVVQEIDLLLKGISEGASRTVEIVKGLKIFSRLDENDLKTANIYDGLDATLIILNNYIVKEKINIIKTYDQSVQMIECYPDKINQVFMNLLYNAIQALNQKKNVEEENVILINTYKEGKHIIIQIKDNGIGIPQKNKSKIFDPFFTTKPIGEGSGLGLSIVYSIIKSHNGEIHCESVEGKETQFTIKLPIRQQQII